MTPNNTKLVERLTASRRPNNTGGFRNPDGREAAILIKSLVEALEAVDLARHTDAANDWERATKLTDAALERARA